MKKAMLFLFSFLCIFSGLCASGKIYFDPDDVPFEDESFYIHQGENVWIQTSCLHADDHGFFTLEEDVYKENDDPFGEFAKKWQCPYCHSWWPLGSPCANTACPSRYKA
jgi:hypothetical protein